MMCSACFTLVVVFDDRPTFDGGPPTLSKPQRVRLERGSEELTTSDLRQSRHGSQDDEIENAQTNDGNLTNTLPPETYAVVSFCLEGVNYFVQLQFLAPVEGYPETDAAADKTATQR